MSNFLSSVQSFVKADRAPITAGIIGGLTVLAAKFGFKMNGSDVAYLSAGVTAAVGVFLQGHFASKPAAPKPTTPEVKP